MPDLDRNKRTVLAFYDLMFNQCRPREAIDLYAGAYYIQHNPGVADGKKGFIAYFEETAARDYPANASSSWAMPLNAKPRAEARGLLAAYRVALKA